MSITDAPITTMSENWRLCIKSGAAIRMRHDLSVAATSIASQVCPGGEGGQGGSRGRTGSARFKPRKPGTRRPRPACNRRIDGHPPVRPRARPHRQGSMITCLSMQACCGVWFLPHAREPLACPLLGDRAPEPAAMAALAAHEEPLCVRTCSSSAMRTVQ